MSAADVFDLQAGCSFLVFGALVIWSGWTLRHLNRTCDHRPPRRFYAVFAAGAVAFGLVTVTFGAVLAGNAVLGVV